MGLIRRKTYLEPFGHVGVGLTISGGENSPTHFYKVSSISIITLPSDPPILSMEAAGCRAREEPERWIGLAA